MLPCSIPGRWDSNKCCPHQLACNRRQWPNQDRAARTSRTPHPIAEVRPLPLTTRGRQTPRVLCRVVSCVFPSHLGCEVSLRNSPCLDRDGGFQDYAHKWFLKVIFQVFGKKVYQLVQGEVLRKVGWRKLLLNKIAVNSFDNCLSYKVIRE